MRSELINIEANEKNLISKLEDLDSENQGLLDESALLHQESSIYKEKAKDLELQLQQSVANESVLTQELGFLEQNVLDVERKMKILKTKTWTR